MTNRILTSMENLEGVLSGILLDIKTRIANKDLSLPYTAQLSKGNYIKINGSGTMYLDNSGQYIELGNVNKSNIDIQKYMIYLIYRTPHQLLVKLCLLLEQIYLLLYIMVKYIVSVDIQIII